MSFAPSVLASSPVYSATDLTLLISACSGSIVAIIAGFRLSRCSKVRLCKCIEIDRDLGKDKGSVAPPNTPESLEIAEDGASMV